MKNHHVSFNPFHDLSQDLKTHKLSKYLDLILSNLRYSFSASIDFKRYIYMHPASRNLCICAFYILHPRFIVFLHHCILEELYA